jgi:hypothetical protein
VQSGPDDRMALIRRYGPGFANVEHFEFTGDQISHVEVYFGRELG